METEKIKINTLITSFVLVIMIDFLLLKVLGLFQISVYARIAIARLIEILALLIIVAKLNNGTASIGITKNTAVSGIKKGLIWSFGFGAVVAILFLIIAVLGTNPFSLVKTRLPNANVDIFFYFIAGGIIAPVAEEIFFRGILFGFFRKHGAVFAAVISTLIFVSIHSIGANIPIPQIVGGLIFALSYELEKSLFVPIIIHASGNIAIFTLSLL